MVKTLTDKNFATGAGIKFILQTDNDTTYSYVPTQFIGDVNGDGFQDIAFFLQNKNEWAVSSIAVLYGSNNLTGTVYLNDNNLVFLNMTQIYNSMLVGGPVIFPSGDITGDKIDDILFINYKSELCILPGSKNGLVDKTSVCIGTYFPSWNPSSLSNALFPPLFTFTFGNVVGSKENDIILYYNNQFNFSGSPYILVVQGGEYLLSGTFSISNFTSIVEAGGWVIDASVNFPNVTSTNIWTVNIGDIDDDGYDDPLLLGAVSTTQHVYAGPEYLLIPKGGQTFTSIIKLFDFNYNYLLYSSDEQRYTYGFFKSAFTGISTSKDKALITKVLYSNAGSNQFSPNCVLNAQDLKPNHTVDMINLFNCTENQTKTWLNFKDYGNWNFVGFIGDFIGKYGNILVPNDQMIQLDVYMWYIYPTPANFSTDVTVIDQINQFGFYTKELIVSWGDFNGNGTDIITSWVELIDNSYTCSLYFKGANNLEETNYEACPADLGWEIDIELCDKPDAPNNNNALSAGAIAGITIGSIAAVGIAATGIFFLYKHYFSGHHQDGLLAGHHDDYGS
jgi:hypothetical protein